MHPHVQFFDKLASRMDPKDPKVARILCGIRDQIEAQEKANSAGRVKMGSQKALVSVVRSITSLMDRYGSEHPEMREILGRFVQKVNRTGSLI
ncbi:MAG: hypothetical protein Q8P59_01005 [Dehalococcoidia bacterium]|nr:hypothetical protein [Dehalococcoidia bacterium]